MVAGVSQVLRSEAVVECGWGKRRREIILFLSAIRPVFYPGVCSYFTPIKINFSFFFILLWFQLGTCRLKFLLLDGSIFFTPSPQAFHSCSASTHLTEHWPQRRWKVDEKNAMNDRYGVMKDEACSTSPKKRFFRDNGGFFWPHKAAVRYWRGRKEAKTRKSRGEKWEVERGGFKRSIGTSVGREDVRVNIMVNLNDGRLIGILTVIEAKRKKVRV